MGEHENIISVHESLKVLAPFPALLGEPPRWRQQIPQRGNIMKLKLLLLVILAVPTTVSADVITDWNAITVQATLTANRQGPSGVIDIAIVHAAMYDAV